MRLSTSTNIYTFNKHNEFADIFESIEFCAKVGFKVIDINFSEATFPHCFLNKDNWQEVAFEIAKLKEKLNLEINQSHPPFYNPWECTQEEQEIYDELISRAIITSGILGVKWNVMHALRFYEPLSFYKKHLELNKKHFQPFVELAQKHNTGIAIENMPDMPSLLGRTKGKIFPSIPEEIIDLILSLSSEKVGACWDFGHGNITEVDAIESIKYLGKHLKATHVNDNFGMTDDHLAPYYGDGNINWENCVVALKEIDYDGDFTFEIHNFINNIPFESRFSCAKYVYDLGNNMLSY